MESHGPLICQPQMKKASGNALQIAPHLWWDLNFHFVFNKSVPVRWQMSWAIFRGITILKIRGRVGFSLFLNRNTNHMLFLWLSGQGFRLALRMSAAFWAQCIPALGDLECLRGESRGPFLHCNRIKPSSEQLVLIWRAVNLNEFDNKMTNGLFTYPPKV